jgi:hypothetical protein
MGVVGEPLVEPGQLGQHRPRLGDRVDAQVRSRPVRGRPVISISHHTKPLWAIATSSSVGSVTIAASAPIAASVSCTPMLACSSSATAATTTSPARPRRLRLVRRDQRGGDTGLHVVGATAVQAIAVDARDMRVGHALDRHRVEVAAEQQRPPATGPARTDEHRGAAGRASSVVTSSPRAAAQRATYRAISTSPAPPGRARG